MLKNRLLRCVLLAAGLVFGTNAARAATAWNEAVSGDLADVGTGPTAVNLALGANLIIGTTGRLSGVVDRDYFTFTLADGWQRDTLSVVSVTALGASALSFIAVQAGPQVTVNPTGNSATGLLGWVHYGENDVGTDILQRMGFGPGATSFSGVSAVPEPSSALMRLAGVAALRGLRHRLRWSAG